MNIIVVGLGYGDPGAISLKAFSYLERASILRLRTKEHPTVSFLIDKGIAFETYDAFYEQASSFDALYQRIAEDLARLAAEHGTVVYGVPGSPSVAESTVVRLRALQKERGFSMQIVEAISFLEPCFALAGCDPVEGFALLDASEVCPATWRSDLHFLITQVWNPFLLSDLKLSLMEIYPEDYPIMALESAGIEGLEKKQIVPLHALDREVDATTRLTIYVPKSTEIPTLYDVALRAWDEAAPSEIDTASAGSKSEEDYAQRLRDLLTEIFTFHREGAVEWARILQRAVQKGD